MPRVFLSPILVVLLGWVESSDAQLLFTDQTSSSQVSNVFSPGVGIAFVDYTGGGAVGDFNRDGYQDVFVPSDGSGGDTDHLFINNGDGTFTDQGLAWGLTAVHVGKGPAVGDFNRDGWLDIYLTSGGPPGGTGPGHHKLYRNNGGASFTDVAVSAGVNFTTTMIQDGFGACFGDYDLDGDLDLFVAGTFTGNVGSILYRNNGDETFTDVTAESAVLAQSTVTVHGFAPRFIDLNGDHYPELLLAADFGTSRYLVNDGDGTFTDRTILSDLGHEENGMGQTVGDLNNDGLIDWYVTSIYRPAVNWTGNKLYLNQGNDSYNEVSAASGCDNGGYGWGAVAIDFDHDGHTDIAETNGGVGGFENEQSYLWMNNGDGTFSEQALSRGFSHFDFGRGLVNFDMDNDGDQDMIVFAWSDPLVLFRNDLVATPNTNWLRVFLSTEGCLDLAPDGYGAKVIAVTGTTTRGRSIDGGDNYLSKSELSAHFGIGSATVVDELRVEWPNGTVDVLLNVPVNQTITVAASCGTLSTFLRGDVNASGTIDVADPVAVLSELFQSTQPVDCSAAADANGDGSVDIADVVGILSYVFGGDFFPAAPFPNCGLAGSPLTCVDGGCP